jgi:hypothetical protein
MILVPNITEYFGRHNLGFLAHNLSSLLPRYSKIQPLQNLSRYAMQAPNGRGDIAPTHSLLWY